jgi:hypothetical protein
MADPINPLFTDEELYRSPDARHRRHGPGRAAALRCAAGLALVNDDIGN